MTIQTVTTHLSLDNTLRMSASSPMLGFLNFSRMSKGTATLALKNKNKLVPKEKQKIVPFFMHVGLPKGMIMLTLSHIINSVQFVTNRNYYNIARVFLVNKMSTFL